MQFKCLMLAIGVVGLYIFAGFYTFWPSIFYEYGIYYVTWIPLIALVIGATKVKSEFFIITTAVIGAVIITLTAFIHIEGINGHLSVVVDVVLWSAIIVYNIFAQGAARGKIC